MAFRFFIDNDNGQIQADPNGAVIGEVGNPIAIPRATTKMEWQWGTKADDGTWIPKRKPASTVIDFGFKQLAVFEGPWVVLLDQTTLVRPTSGTGLGYLVNFGGGYAITRTSIAVDGGSGTILAGDTVIIGNYRYLVIVGLSGGVIIIEDAGLKEFVPDDYPVIVDTEAGFYTGDFLGDTTGSPGSQQLLLTPDGNTANDLDAIPMHGALLWTIPTNTGAPETTQRIYSTLFNSFDQGGGPAAVSVFPQFQFRIDIIGITGGGLTKLDGLPTIGRGFNFIEFLDSAGGTGTQTYQLQSSTAATAAPGLIRAADYATTTNEKVWVSV